MNAGTDVTESFKETLPKVERFFNDDSAVSFEAILDSFIKELVEFSVHPSYHHDTVNAATSHEGVA
ncbi:hypothetical protein [Cohnella yongneupensis]|uniref:Transposase n=1 Tax=Cohnella yongneupensis TaxID=425006 RepID=A0ABW0R064_9BACL